MKVCSNRIIVLPEIQLFSYINEAIVLYHVRLLATMLYVAHCCQ
jgi:hypothetical protein